MLPGTPKKFTGTNFNRNQLSLLTSYYFDVMQYRFGRQRAYILDPEAESLLLEYDGGNHQSDLLTAIRRLAFLCLHRQHIYAEDVANVIRHLNSERESSGQSLYLEELLIKNPDAPLSCEPYLPGEPPRLFFARQFMKLIEDYAVAGCTFTDAARKFGLDLTSFSHAMRYAASSSGAAGIGKPRRLHPES